MDIFDKNKFILKGFRIGIVNSLKIVSGGLRDALYPTYDYFRWSSNIKIFSKVPGKKKKAIIYIEENRDLLNVYDVVDIESQERIGVIRYHFGSWEILDDDDNYFKIAPTENIIKEMFFLKHILYDIIVDKTNKPMGAIKKISPFFAPVFYKYQVDFSLDEENILDKRLALATLTLFVYAHERFVSTERTKYFLRSKVLKLVDKHSLR
ncbi:MAG: hypothetical protein GY858_00730 [Candidatus Omnitrophica bacterium]|nr:hypothetical protein [Candidatus Omnitrophota bacterium]